MTPQQENIVLLLVGLLIALLILWALVVDTSAQSYNLIKPNNINLKVAPTEKLPKISIEQPNFGTIKEVTDADK